jgi:hypothetical protein
MYRQQRRLLAASFFLFASLPTAGCVGKGDALPVTTAAPIAIFPPDAIALNDNYRDWYGPTLEEMKEGPLWVDDRAAQSLDTFRFTFIPGAMRTTGRHATVIRIDVKERVASLVVRAQFNDRSKRTIRTIAEKLLSPAEIAKLKELADQADPWQFRVGTWEEPDQISIHCTELVMERRQSTNYAVSHILISCNHPNRLLPLVNYVAELAGEKREALRY